MSTRPDAVQLLAHVVEATTFIIHWTDGKTLEEYTLDPYLRSAVERQFINIGEAINLLREIEPSTAASIADYRHAISFRNVLVHGFFQVNNSRVWNIVTENLPSFHRQVSQLLEEAEKR